MSKKPKMPGANYKSGRRWAVEPVVIGEAMGYLEHDLQYEFRVVNKATGQVVMSFPRRETRTPDGSVYGGVQSVEVSGDDTAVVVIFEDGQTERHLLPIGS